MTRREQLQEQYEDALFALLMDEYAQIEGERLLEENERLKLDPDADIPEDVMRRCRKVINREFSRKAVSTVCYTSWRVFKKVSVVACSVVLLFTVAFAASETVRVNTLNLMIEVFDRHTDYRFSQGPKTGNTSDYPEFEVGWLPEGFNLISQIIDQSTARFRYENSNGETIVIGLDNLGESGVTTFDTEDAVTEDVTINGRSATLFTKDYYQIVIPIPEKTQLFWVAFWTGNDLPSREELLRIAENISLN